MKKTWIVNIRILSLVTMLVLLTGCSMPIPHSYSAESIEGWFVDEDTKRPLDGVIVVAVWIIQGYTFGNRFPLGQLKIMEAVTDKNGRFYFPAWGPKMVLRGQLDFETPELIMFKNGYRAGAMSNDYRKKQNGSKRYSDWNGKIITLPKFEGSLEEYGDHLSTIGSILRFALRNPTSACEWKKIPRMVVAIHKQRLIFGAARISNLLYSIDELAKNSPKSCGSPHAFFRSYL